jgi:RNA polymerase sigma factor (sigma-70 family)
MNNDLDHLFRRHSAKIVATLTRVFGSRHLDLAEDVVQDALLKALQQWPFKGVPENPAAWLTLVAKNRALDLLRRDASLASKAEQLELALPRLAFSAAPSDVEMDAGLTALDQIDAHHALRNLPPAAAVAAELWNKPATTSAPPRPTNAPSNAPVALPNAPSLRIGSSD